MPYRLKRLPPSSRLIDDLGADSLDFLDIIFTLEKQFSTKLRDPNLDLLVRADFSQNKTADQTTLSKDVLQQLSDWLPGLQEVQNPEEISIRNLYSYITVDTLVLWVQKKLLSSHQ